jgi:casein kinase II subunit beta
MSKQLTKTVIGSHFGTAFPHLFIQAFPDSIKYVEPNIYVARLFGFRISELSVAGPRMQWLRMVKDQQESKKKDMIW